MTSDYTAATLTGNELAREVQKAEEVLHSFVSLNSGSNSGAPSRDEGTEAIYTNFTLPGARSDNFTQAQAVRDLLARLLPNQCSLFHVSVLPSMAQNGTDTVQVCICLRLYR